MTNRQLLFVEEYLKCANATEAAKKAGYSKKTAYSIGQRLLKNVEVADRIRKRLTEKVMDADEVLERLTEHGRGLWGNYIQADGSVDIAALKADGKAYLIRETEVTHRTYKDGSVETTGKVKFPDSQAAIVQMGRHWKLFTDNVAHSGEVTVKGYANVSPDDWDEANTPD